MRHFKKAVVILAMTEFLIAIGCAHKPSPSNETTRAAAIPNEGQYAAVDFAKYIDSLGKFASQPRPE